MTSRRIRSFIMLSALVSCMLVSCTYEYQKPVFSVRIDDGDAAIAALEADLSRVARAHDLASSRQVIAERPGVVSFTHTFVRSERFAFSGNGELVLGIANLGTQPSARVWITARPDNPEWRPLCREVMAAIEGRYAWRPNDLPASGNPPSSCA